MSGGNGSKQEPSCRIGPLHLVTDANCDIPQWVIPESSDLAGDGGGTRRGFQWLGRWPAKIWISGLLAAFAIRWLTGVIGRSRVLGHSVPP
jgi:hypothetical protein